MWTDASARRVPGIFGYLVAVPILIYPVEHVSLTFNLRMRTDGHAPWGAGEFPIFIGVLVQPDPRRQVACTPMSTSITERVFDATDVPKQFREPPPKRAPGRPLSSMPEVADELCERLEADKQICGDARMPDWKTLRRHRVHSAGRRRRTPGRSSFYAARARVPTSRQIAYVTERSTVARRVILSVPLTRPGILPKADRSPCLTQLPHGDKRERHRGGMVTRNGEAWKDVTRNRRQRPSGCATVDRARPPELSGCPLTSRPPELGI